jgi:hypothetical protein
LACEIVRCLGWLVVDVGWVMEILWTGRSYPGGVAQVRERARREFLRHRDESDPMKLKILVAKGERALKDLHDLNQFHKYRVLRAKYDQQHEMDADTKRMQSALLTRLQE